MFCENFGLVQQSVRKFARGTLQSDDIFHKKESMASPLHSTTLVSPLLYWGTESSKAARAPLLPKIQAQFQFLCYSRSLPSDLSKNKTDFQHKRQFPVTYLSICIQRRGQYSTGESTLRFLASCCTYSALYILRGFTAIDGTVND